MSSNQWTEKDRIAWGKIMSENPYKCTPLDVVAQSIYDFCCTARSKDGKNPREVGCEFETLMDEPKEFYRNVARWYFNMVGVRK